MKKSPVLNHFWETSLLSSKDVPKGRQSCFTGFGVAKYSTIEFSTQFGTVSKLEKNTFTVPNHSRVGNEGVNWGCIDLLVMWIRIIYIIRDF